MDVKLFLEGQAGWEKDSPHHLMMLHKMFQHASEQGRREAEHMVHQGCQQGLLKLDPEADVPAVQLVGPMTSRKEIESLYYEVYKLPEATRVSTQRARTRGRGGVLLGRLPRVGTKGNTTDVRGA